MEEYHGVKFKSRKTDVEIPPEKVRKFLELDKLLSEFLSPEQNEGNMSMRLEQGFLIKRAGARMSCLEKNDVSWVLETGDEIVFSGAEPSSEARMHASIYNNASEAGIVLHFHDDGMLSKYKGPSIGPYEYGTAELAKAAGEMAGKRNEFMIKEHGFVIIANDVKELIERLHSWKKS
jgi:ribulose-5-phosphate 4-epimerase/fuculose-1-phosphate aldolase